MEVRFDGHEDAECTAGLKKASEGSFVLKDAVLLEFKVNGKVVGKIKTHGEGVVNFTKGLKPGQPLSKGQVIATVTDCNHAIVIKDMCATCGKDLRQKDGRAGERKETATANVSMIHHVPELIVSDKLAQELGSADETNLINNRKLVLLVDLDQTIIHTSDKKIDVDMEKHKDLTTYEISRRLYTTKLRPHTTEFLNKMSELYEMHIVTYGQRQYAHKIAAILDPDGRLFGQRILSRDELFSAQHKTRNLKALFPCGDNLVVIIDDRADVWQYSEALIQIKPYRFFKEIGDINAPKNSKEQMPVEIEDDAHEDRVLEEIERVLTNIHDKYYEKMDMSGKDQQLLDVKDVIKLERHKVLDGCTILFSGIVPMGELIEGTDVYRLCKQFGAAISSEMTDEVTHVVAARYGTQKVHQAVRLGKHVVTVQWVYACVEKWMKADEKLHELTRETTPPAGRPLGSKYVNDLANITTIGKAVTQDMENEVDEALSDEDEDDEDDEEKGEKEEEEEEEKEEDDKKEKGDDKKEKEEAEEMMMMEKEEKPAEEVKKEVKKGKKRKHCPEEEYESEEDEDDDQEPPMSYRQLLSKSKKAGRIVSGDDEEEVFDVDDEKGHVAPNPDDDVNDEDEDDDMDDDDEDVPEDSDDDEFEDMAALVERQISERDDDIQ